VGTGHAPSLFKFSLTTNRLAALRLLGDGPHVGWRSCRTPCRFNIPEPDLWLATASIESRYLGSLVRRYDIQTARLYKSWYIGIKLTLTSNCTHCCFLTSTSRESE
jgi:hypothetical protein